MIKVLVCDPIADKGVEILQKDTGFQVDVRLKLTEDEIAAIAADYQAIVVRSETRITQKIMEAATLLKVIGRAGVGVDNIDVSFATKKGIVVINAPDGNTIAACELTMALILSLVRHVPQADQLLKSKVWDKKKFTGVELRGKTIGVLGLGRIGAETAVRCKAFGMRVLAYDPYVTPERAANYGAEISDKDTIYKEADLITVHMPLTDETRNMIGKDQFALMKPSVRLINVARGGIINEEELVEALKSGKVAGAALDVFAKEPITDHPLFDLPQVVVTPHLGASTQEAQVNVALDVAEEIKRILNGLPINNAVNIPFIRPEIMDKARPFMSLAEKLGRLAAYLAEGPIKEIEVKYFGDFKGIDIRPLNNSVLKGLLRPVMNESVNYVNSPVMAKERGINVIIQQNEKASDYTNKIAVTIKGDKWAHSFAGSVFENDEVHIVEIDSLVLDFRPVGHMLLVPHIDQPKVVGPVGMLLGENGVNIGGMQLGRHKMGGEALMILTVDDKVDDAVLKALAKLPAVKNASYLNFE